MVKTLSISEDTPERLTMRLNDWLKQWPDEKILGIEFIHRPSFVKGAYLAFVAYQT